MTDNNLHSPLKDNIELLHKVLNTVLSGQLAPDVVEKIANFLRDAKEIEHAKRSSETAEILNNAMNKLFQSLKTLPEDQILPITQAFSQYLNLTDIAEQYHRIRRRRWHQRELHSPQPGSIEATLPELLKQGISPEKLLESVSQLQIELVLTAHPTEITRRSIMRKQQDIAKDLETLDSSDLLTHERLRVMQNTEEAITAAWQTKQVRGIKPTAVHEANWGFSVVEESLWDAVPAFLRDLDRCLLQTTGHNLPLTASPIRFGSWMGGDRDGNPNVTASTTREVLLLARWKAADLYLKDIENLSLILSMDEASPALKTATQNAEEPYRALLRNIRERLLATKGYSEHRLQINQQPMPEQKIYCDSQELLEPLLLCYNSLRDTGAVVIANGALLDTIRRVVTFGLTLLPLDIRQDAAKHTELMNAITEQLGLGRYQEWSEEKRQTFLHEKLQDNSRMIPADVKLVDPLQEYLDTFRLIGEPDSQGLNTYIISMASQPSDVLLVQFLQQQVGVQKTLPIVPLFETLAALQGAGSCIDQLLQFAAYKKICNGLQEVLIGYSDSAKEVGFLAASWAQYQAQEDLVKVAKQHGIRLVLFHGRGGSTGRGGEPTHLAIRGQPPGSVDGRLRVTQQGEVIRHRLGLRKIAERTFEVYTSATLVASLLPSAAPEAKWRTLMEKLSASSLKVYQSYAKNNADFYQYFKEVTPADEFDNLAIGSRPARRRDTGDLSGLRAIPWIFAWTQNRLLLPIWLGVGEALEAAVKEFGLDTIQEVKTQWSYFSSLLGMQEMVLAKADPYISLQYENHLLEEALKPMGENFRKMFFHTKDILLSVLDESQLLAHNSVLDRSIQLRIPYLLPLHLLQVFLLEKTRQTTGNMDPVLSRALLVSISGIAAGMHNTG